MSTGRLGAGDTAIQPTILNAKADLLTATAADTPARLAVGNNGETLVADSSATTGLRWQGDYAAGKNKIINGDFNINQRGFTSTTATTYTFDRFRILCDGGTVTTTAETFTLGTAPVAGYEGKNFVRIDSTGQSAAADRTLFSQAIESVRTLAGQTATVSFWAKAGSGAPKVAVDLVQSFGSGGSPSSAVTTLAGQITLSTSWARYSVTVSVPSISGKTLGTANDDYLFIGFWTSAGTDWNARTGSLGIQTATIDLWGVQVEEGSVATAFQTATGTLAGELAACQRYFWKEGGSHNTPYGMGYVGSATAVYGWIATPTYMREKDPTLSYSNVRATTAGVAGLTLSALVLRTTTGVASSNNLFGLEGTTTGAVAGRPVNFENSDTTAGFIQLDAEL
jgi:hypothetical protein